jgi:two-component system, LuxR family, response regulator FixJ
MLAAPGGPIFVADEDEDYRTLVSQLLERAGFTTRALPTGEDVLAAVAEERPALVVLDVALPGLNGYEVCRQLRDTYGETISIVFVSGARTEPFDRVAGLLVGADDYIVKPFDSAELIARVRRLAARHAPNLEPTRPDPELEALTPREREVLTLLTEGYRQSEIARKLVISPRTVATHIQRVLKKLHVHERAQAVALALRANGEVGRADAG